MLSRGRSSSLPAFPREQVLARAVLALTLGVTLLTLHAASWLVVTGLVALMLLADGLLGLLVRSRRATPHPAMSWLRPMWQALIVLAVAAFLALALQPSSRVASVMTITAAVAAGLWLATFYRSGGLRRRAVLVWAAVMLITGGALRVGWFLHPEPDALWNLGVLGSVQVVGGLLMLWWAPGMDYR